MFAEPVAELGLAMALNLARNIVDADLAFRQGEELWGGDGNQTARLLSGADVGIVGFGDLGKALNRLLAGFRDADQRLRPVAAAFDPGSTTASSRRPSTRCLSSSDFVFVVASVTSENQGFLGADAFARMRKGAAFILLSPRRRRRFRCADGGGGRAAISSPPATSSPKSRWRGTILCARCPGFLRSAHRAGALDIAFKRMGDMVLEDMDLIDRGLPPMRSKRAERETVSRMRSKPVTRN